MDGLSVGRGGMRIGLGSQIYMLARDRFCAAHPSGDLVFELRTGFAFISVSDSESSQHIRLFLTSACLTGDCPQSIPRYFK